MRPTYNSPKYLGTDDAVAELAAIRGRSIPRSTWYKWLGYCYLTAKATYTTEDMDRLRRLAHYLNGGGQVRVFQEELLVEMERELLGIQTIDVQPHEVIAS